MLTADEQTYLDALRRGDDAAADHALAALDAADAERAARLGAPEALRDAAAWYAAHGVAVFPCMAGGKRPLTRHGLHDATTDAAQVSAWWAATPEANIGLPTGHRFDVIDLDGPAGIVAFHDLVDAGGFTEPVLARAFTPHGRHYLIAPTGSGNRARMLAGVDYRGIGGYVVAAPSRTPEGTYRWFDGQNLDPAILPAPAVAA